MLKGTNRDAEAFREFTVISQQNNIDYTVYLVQCVETEADVTMMTRTKLRHVSEALAIVLKSEIKQ